MKPKPFTIAILVVGAVLMLSLSGCALLAIPATIIGESFKIIGTVLKIVSKMPMPPPGVF